MGRRGTEDISNTTSAPSAVRSRILIVDDDDEMRDSLGSFFQAQGLDCKLAGDAVAALRVVERESVDAVVCDVRMDGMNGLELLDRVKRTHPALPVVVITAMGEIRDAVDAIKRGAFYYMTKPCDPDELQRAVASAIEMRNRLDTKEGPYRIHLAMTASVELVGNGSAMRSLNATIDFVAASSAPVVVTGETGTGKDLVARAIHLRGARRNRPFVAVNTSAIPQELLEAEIFGHV
ncbi:MAG TPA: response regulator, partial [Polyangiaceae bacterium]|nr:response regulator [Polyangiaceae bacterium]